MRSSLSFRNTGCRVRLRRGSPRLWACRSRPSTGRSRNRKGMLLAAADKVWQQRRDEFESFEWSDAMDRLRKICESHTKGIQTDPGRPLHHRTRGCPTDRWAREHLREQQLSEARHFADVVDEGKAQGCIRPDVDSRRRRGGSCPCTGRRRWLAYMVWKTS